MMKKIIQPRKIVSYSRNPKRKSKTVPDQALTPAQIMEKYLKGLPVSVTKRDPIYMDQDSQDYERLDRMDFDEKFAYAADLKSQAAGMEQQLTAQQQQAQDELVRRKREKQAKAAAKNSGASASEKQA